MTDDDPDAYEINRIPSVNAQIRRLAIHATEKGRLSDFFAALKGVLTELTERPLDWGDPEYHTRKKGGIVCHGTRSPLFVQYAVFEEERLVIILKINAISGTYLA